MQHAPQHVDQHVRVVCCGISRTAAGAKAEFFCCLAVRNTAAEDFVAQLLLQPTINS
jgi:hypothetical protein